MPLKRLLHTFTGQFNTYRQPRPFIHTGGNSSLIMKKTLMHFGTIAALASGMMFAQTPDPSDCRFFRDGGELTGLRGCEKDG